MKDIQNQRDFRNIPINKVGIKNLRYPIRVLDRKNGFQQTVANINMYVDLPHENKGTHMSRFVEMLHMFRPEVSLKSFSTILEQMKKDLNAASASNSALTGDRVWPTAKPVAEAFIVSWAARVASDIPWPSRSPST